MSYSVSRMGLDGAGSVSSVANISPDANGNVPLAAENINALPANGGTMYGGINMSGHTISGLNAPTANDQAANMGFVNQQVKNAGATNVLVNSYFANPVNPIGSQIYEGAGNTIAEWDSSSSAQTVTVKDGCIEIAAGGSSLGIIHQIIPERFSKYMRGKVYTLAVCDDDGLVQVASGVCTEEDVSSNTSVFVTSSSDKLWYANLYKLANEQLFDLRINVKKGSTCRFKWAGLYPGEHTAETLREYQPKGYGVEVVNCNGGALSTELLWENGSPSDSFVAQDIATADVGHNFIMIEFRASSSSSTYALSPFIRTNNKTVPFDYFTNSGALQRRRVKVSKTNISFEKGLLNNSEDNSLMIPIRIYAIKGASV